jgi:hypothetical protein
MLAVGNKIHLLIMDVNSLLSSIEEEYKKEVLR